jgi:hypothetical protein
MVAADRGQTSAGKASGSGRKAAGPAISEEAHAFEDTSENVETPNVQAYSITRPFAAIDD